MESSDRREKIVKRLDDSPDLVDIMISIEDYLDTSNIYVFKNWMDGELIDGPYVEPYWVRVTFKWPHKQMPDPAGGLRLLQHGTKIFFKLCHENVPQPINTPSDYEPGTHKPKIKPEKVWTVEMLIPRRFIEEIDDKVLDLYGEQTDIDKIDSFGDEGTPDQTPTAQPSTDQSGIDQPGSDIPPTNAAPPNEQPQ